ncbi:hypothetical protein ACFLSJ_01410 [Verrucomicrobiota bacterium]
MTQKQRQLVREIRRLHRQGEPLNITAVKRRHPSIIKKVYAVKPSWGWKRALADAGIEYRKVKFQLEPYVDCRLCGGQFAHIALHLPRRHACDAAEYLRDYPDAEAFSEEMRATFMRRGHKKRLLIPHWERPWSDEYVLDRVAELHRRGFPLNHCFAKKDVVLEQAVKRFGTWDMALSQAGLNPATVRKLPPFKKWSAEAVVEGIRARHEAGLDLAAKRVQEGAQANKMLYEFARRFLGSWENAVVAAHLDPSLAHAPPRPRQYPTPESVVAEIRRRRRLGLPINCAGVARWEGRDAALFNSAVDYFGGWGKAVEAAGFDYDDVHLRRRGQYSTRKGITEAIRGRLKRGLHMKATAVRKDNQLLHTAALENFGSWELTVRAAGIDCEKVLPALSYKYRTAEAVVKEIRRRHRKNWPLNSAGIQKPPHPDSRLYRRGVAPFGGWPQAIEAAGLDFGRIRDAGRAPYRTEEDVVRELRRRKRAGVAMTSTAVQMGRNRDYPLYYAVKKLFGGWQAAVAAAEKPATQGKRRRK